MLSGYKTYLVALLMLVHAITGYFLGHDVPLDIKEILVALGLAALRHGVATTR